MMIIVIALSLTQPAPCKRDTVAEHTTTDTWPIKAWRWQIEGIFCMDVLSPKNSNQFGNTHGKRPHQISGHNSLWRIFTSQTVETTFKEKPA